MDDETVKRLELLARRRDEASEERHQLAQETATAVRDAHARGATPTDLAQRLRVSRQAIYDFLNTRQYTALVYLEKWTAPMRTALAKQGVRVWREADGTDKSGRTNVSLDVEAGSASEARVLIGRVLSPFVEVTPESFGPVAASSPDSP